MLKLEQYGVRHSERFSNVNSLSIFSTSLTMTTVAKQLSIKLNSQNLNYRDTLLLHFDKRKDEDRLSSSLLYTLLGSS